METNVPTEPNTETITLAFTKNQVNTVLTGLSVATVQLAAAEQTNKLIFGSNEAGEKHILGLSENTGKEYLRFMEEARKIWANG